MGCWEESVAVGGAACTKPWSLEGRTEEQGPLGYCRTLTHPAHPARPVLGAGSHHSWRGSRQGFPEGAEAREVRGGRQEASGKPRGRAVRELAAVDLQTCRGVDREVKK